MIISSLWWIILFWETWSVSQALMRLNTGYNYTTIAASLLKIHFLSTLKIYPWLTHNAPFRKLQRLMTSIYKTLINGEIHSSIAFPEGYDPLVREQIKHERQQLQDPTKSQKRSAVLPQAPCPVFRFCFVFWRFDCASSWISSVLFIFAVPK